MRISEIIKHLEDIGRREGDLEVWRKHEGGECWEIDNQFYSDVGAIKAEVWKMSSGGESKVDSRVLVLSFHTDSR
jgi:hypothetical protein